MTGLLFGSFFVFMFLGVPIAVALGLSAVIAITAGLNSSLIVTAQSMFNGINSFPLMAIPFFILAGNMMGEGGISRKLVTFVNLLFSRITGGLAMVSIGASMFFAAISGSCPATTAAIGGIMVPEMKKSGYEKEFAAATVAAAGTVGTVIPPSIPMVTYCVLANTSVSTLFLAGVGPGLLMGLAMMLVAYAYARKKCVPVIRERKGAKEVLSICADSIWAWIMPVIILGGIYSGIFTPTEAGAVAAIYSMIVGLFIYKELRWKDIPAVICNSAVTASVTMLIMATIATFGYVLTMARIPQLIASSLLSFTTNKYVLLFLFNIVVLIAGCFLNPSAAIALLTPILLPVLTSVGINPYMVGIVFVVNMSIGMITPPVGNCLYVACNIADIKFEKLVRACIPYLVALLLSLLAITYIEPISMGLVHAFG